jgi:hypothetical protein
MASDRRAPWPDGFDLLIFCAGVTAFVYVALAALQLLGVAPPAQEQTLFRYGGTAVLIMLLLVGSVSFLFGGLAARYLKRARARWLSGGIGGAYSLVTVVASAFIPLSQFGIGGKVLGVFILLFPAIGLFLGALTLKPAVADSAA